MNRAAETLTRLLSLDISDPLDKVGKIHIQSMQTDMPRAVRKALSDRQELKEPKTAAEDSLRIARSDRWPTVSLFADLFRTSPEYKESIDES